VVSWSTETVPGPNRIVVEHAGQGEPVILLHGVGGNRTFWREQIAALAPHFHAIAWDARGYGDSDDFTGPMRFEDVADDLLRVLDHFGVSKAHLVGMSIGGIFVMKFYERYPERALSLTLCDTGRPADLTPEARAEFFKLRQQPLLDGKTPADIAPEVARSMLSPSAVEGAYEILHGGYVALRKDTLLRMIETGMNLTHVDFAGVKVPAHVVSGADDRTSPPEMARGIAAEIPGAELSLIPHAGHISNIDQPDGFNQAMLGFLKKHAGNSS
jgi:3-oxoadipate enol-lactonase